MKYNSVWWFVKVSAGLALVCILVFSAFDLTISPRIRILPPWCGQALALAGGTINLVHFAFLKKETKNIADPVTPVTRAGLYRWIRHPMYLGDLWIMLGLTLLADQHLAWVVLFAGIVAVVRLCAEEDRKMLARFQDAYKSYLEKTRGLFPFIY